MDKESADNNSTQEMYFDYAIELLDRRVIEAKTAENVLQCVIVGATHLTEASCAACNDALMTLVQLHEIIVGIVNTTATRLRLDGIREGIDDHNKFHPKLEIFRDDSQDRLDVANRNISTIKSWIKGIQKIEI